MQRRTLLRLSLGAGAVIAVAGTGAALWAPGLSAGKLSAGARTMVNAVSAAVLDGLLPTAPEARTLALQAQLERFELTVANLPPATRKELSDLLALLSSAAGRWSLTSLHAPWETASVAEVSAALEMMRMSSMDTRQQIYHALRDLTTASWFSDAAHWAQMGYPGPRAL